jgi:putative protease
LKPGDGLVFDAADWRTPQELEEGGRLFTIEPREAGLFALGFANGALHPSRIRAGDWLWRSDDPTVGRSLKVYTQPTAPVRKLPVDVAARLLDDNRLELVWNGVITVTSDPLPDARTNGLSQESLRKQLERLGGTAFELRTLTFEPVRAVFAPASALNDLRRRAVEALSEHLGTLRPVKAVEISIDQPAGPPADGPARLHLLVRTPDQLDAAIALRPASITLDYLDLYGLKPSLDRVREAGLQARVATPRVIKPGEEKVVDFLLGLDCPLLIRPLGLLHLGRGTGDFSLNAANRVSARELLAAGLDRITPTHDLNGAQVAELARQVGGARIEAIVYQHLPVFHTEHCVFCRFLSTGTSYKDCGRPCETHRVELSDPTGRRHPVLADVGCRNTVFGSEAQESSAHLDAWLTAGVRHFRLEFAHESAAQVKLVAEAFKDALASRLTPLELRRKLSEAAPHGITEGSLAVAQDYLELPILE